MVDSIPLDEIPTAGLVGHISGKQLRSKVPQTDALEKLKQFAAGGCPVNKKTEITLSEAGFIVACKKFKETAEKDRGKKNKSVTTTPTGFKSSNKRVCLDCKIGDAVAAGKPFTPPKGICLKELKDLHGRAKYVKPIPEKKVKVPAKKVPAKKRVKLTKQDVIRIRQMHAEGYSVPGLCEIFPVTTSTMYRVVNYESWRNVK